jgi:hypothetical protein
MYGNCDKSKISYKKTEYKEVKMTQLKKRAIWGLLIWGLALIAAYSIFFMGGGPQTFLKNDTRVALTRAVFTVGFISYFLALFLTRTKSDSKELMKDERDELISKRAYSTGFYSLMIYVFLICLVLYAYYKVHLNSVDMPIGWVWLLGITTYFMGFVSHAIATLVLYGRMSGDGES